MVATKLCNFNSATNPAVYGLLPAPPADSERQACLRIDPPGFHLRPPPAPHHLTSFITPDTSLFQTIHMGPAVVDRSKWRLVIDGMVQRPFSMTYAQLMQFTKVSVTSFHECYGSPIKPPTVNLWRVGNVTWSGVRLSDLLALAEPLPCAEYVWSEGLDYGSFGGVDGIDRYQKDLPLQKAWKPEVLVAWQINGEELGKERGGPVRLVVPGWFGTNSTKWLCGIQLRGERSASLFTTRWYNEVDPVAGDGSLRPVWGVEPNSMIVWPAPGEVVGREVLIRGWAWSCDGIEKVEIDVDDRDCWEEGRLRERREFEWQGWEVQLCLMEGIHAIRARAVSKEGLQQPLSGRRNHVHEVMFRVQEYHIAEDPGD